MTAVRHAPARAEPDDGPLGRFLHDVDYTRFDSRVGRFVPLALAVLVAVVAAGFGAMAALAVGVLIGVGLTVAVVVFERDRWRAQDVLHWYQVDRVRRWQAATASGGPRGDPAEAEVWLGVHQPGTVPQVYRAIAAIQSGDDVVIAREIAALPEATPNDRAWRLWVIETRRVLATGDVAVGRELRDLIPSLSEADDRVALETWLAQVDGARLHAGGDPAWLAPMVAMWPRTRRVPLGARRVTRLWVSRFIVLPIFAISALSLAAIGVQLANQGERIPDEFYRTSLFTRGDVPAFDAGRVATTLPALARAIAIATLAEPEMLDAFAANSAIDQGLPTVIWETDRIDLPPPPQAGGRHIWSIEVLLGDERLDGPRAILTFDREDGPAWLYRIDPQVVASLRDAAGIGPSQAP